MRTLNENVRHKLKGAMVCLLAAAPFFLIYKELVSPRIAPLLLKQDIVSTTPEVSVAPQPIADLTPSKTAGTIVTLYGNTFEVPWREIGRRIAGDTAVITFAPRIGIMIWSPTSKVGSLLAAPLDDTARRAHISYGEESATLDMTPSQIRFFDPPQVSAARVSLLFRKALSGGPEFKTGIYRFQTTAIHGFQLGNPTQSSQARLDMFDPAGNSLGEILCVFGRDATARGTQSDLNRIIQTFHPVANVAGPSASPKVRPQRAASR